MTVRIDLHLHTLSVDGKDNGFTFSMAWLKKYVESVGLDAIAITNHNFFDLAQFDQIQEKLECTVLPGIELSLKEGHVNIVFENTVEIKQKLRDVSEQLDLGETGSLTITEYKDIFNSFDQGLMIFEYGKSNSLPIDEDFDDDFFRDYTFVRGVSSQLKFQKALMQEESFCPVLFSDGHATDDDPDPARNDISKLSLKTTFVQMEKFNYQQLLRELKKPQHIWVTEEGLANIFQIEVDHEPVNVSTKLNLVVGRRGSGKTYFLDHIQNQYGHGDTIVSYIRQFKSIDDTKEYLKRESNKIALEARQEWVNKHKSQLDGIVTFYTNPITDEVTPFFQSLRRFANEIVTSGFAKKVKLFSQSSFEIIELIQYQKTLSELKDVIEAKDLWMYVSDEHRSQHVDNLIVAYEELRNNLEKEEVSNSIKEFANSIISDVKTIVQKNTAIDPVSDLDLYHQFEHYEEQKKILHFMSKAIAEPRTKTVPKYTYTIRVSKKPWSGADEFLNSVPNKGMRPAVKDSLIKPYLNQQYREFLESLFSGNYQNHFDLVNGFGLSRYLFEFNVELLTTSGTKASGGQQVALGLMMKLDDAKKSDIVLVDEPEGSLDNVFIKDELIPKLHDLAQNTPVFVITHNSTLGALLDPDRLIIAKFDAAAKKYLLLSGDFLSRKVYDNIGHEQQSYEDFIDAMEAGISTYEKKGVQYANLKS